MAGLIYPWRAGNQFQLLVDGPAFFNDWLAQVDQAVGQIDIELYLVSSGKSADRVEEALIAAVQRGVRVRCLFDSFGSRGFRSAQRRRWLEAGIELRFYNPLRWTRGLENFYRDHRKLFIVDQQVAYIGGTGLTDEFWDPDTEHSQWHEVMVRVKGPVVTDWQSLFDYQWGSCIHRFFWQQNNSPKQVPRHSVPPLPVTNLGKARLAYAASTQHRDIQKSLLRTIKGAHGRVVGRPFPPAWAIRRALQEAAVRGLDVRLLPPDATQFTASAGQGAVILAAQRVRILINRVLHKSLWWTTGWCWPCNLIHWDLRFKNNRGRDADL